MDTNRNFLEVRLQEKLYAIPVEFVTEINPVGDITPVPGSGAHVCGLMNLRGLVLPVVDLKVRLGQKQTPHTRESCIVVVDSLEGIVGLLVDGVARILSLPSSQLLPAPEPWHLSDLTLITGVAKDGNKLIMLLNVTRCLFTGKQSIDVQH